MTAAQIEAYRMARLDLATHGIKMDKQPFKELLIELFHGHFRAVSSVDELLLRPRQAIRYCDIVRDELARKAENEAFDLPDDVILRTLLGMRKNP